jgi:hypothetical protein
MPKSRVSRHLHCFILNIIDTGPDKQFILDRLPANYSLREHQRTLTTTPDGQKKRTTSDVYLHGYSSSSAQKFRSPAEFFPHLLWLVTGYGTCGCKYCPTDGTDRAIDSLRSSPVSPRVTTPPQTALEELGHNLDPALLEEAIKSEYSGTPGPSPNGRSLPLNISIS